MWSLWGNFEVFTNLNLRVWPMRVSNPGNLTMSGLAVNTPLLPTLSNVSRCGFRQ